MKRRNLFILLAIVIGVPALAVVALVVVAGIGLYRLGDAVSDHSSERFARVQVGMTGEQVVQVMQGTPARQYPSPDGTVVYDWWTLEGTAHDVVRLQDGRVVWKSPADWHPPLGDVTTRPTTAL